MRSNININKLKRNTIIIVETEETVFEIVVTGPKSGAVAVTGGIAFVRQTKARLTTIIEKRRPMTFLFKNKKGKDDAFTTSRVLSATIFSSDRSWYYDAIEKKDKR